MRHDIVPSTGRASPFKLFTWGYVFFRNESRWRFYWWLRLPGLHWAYNPCNDDFEWQNMMIRYLEGSGLEWNYVRKLGK